MKRYFKSIALMTTINAEQVIEINGTPIATASPGVNGSIVIMMDESNVVALAIARISLSKASCRVADNGCAFRRAL